MRKGVLIAALVLVAIGACWPQLEYAWEEVCLRMAEHHIKANGPDKETAELIESMPDRVLPRRDNLVALCRPYLDGRDPVKACAALQIFWTLRRPSTALPVQGAFARFDANLDKLVMDNFSHWTLFRNSDSYRDISLYLSLLPSPQGTNCLKEIASSTRQNGQALICVAWRRDPADMDFLLPFMLEDSMEALSLPYHFRNSYGIAAVPYLRRAVSEAKMGATREEAQKELRRIEQQPATEP
jgi:hypothetical protein